MHDVPVRRSHVKPITLASAKEHAVIIGNDADAKMGKFIFDAQDYVENYCRRALVAQHRRLTMDYFPWQINLQRSPLRSVTSIKYLDTAGVLTTLDPSTYRVDKSSEPPRIVPASGFVWPATMHTISSVVVDYIAGHLIPFTADAATDTLTAAGHGYVDGDVISLSESDGTIPAGLVIGTDYHVIQATADTLKLSAAPGGAAIDITTNGAPPNLMGDLPSSMSSAMLLLIAFWSENREVVNIGNISTSLDFTVDALLAPYRITRF